MLWTKTDNQDPARVLWILLSVAVFVWPLTTQSAVGAALPNAKQFHADCSHSLTLEDETLARLETLDSKFRVNGKGATSYWHC